MMNQEQMPFFARFLEGQFPQVRTDIKAGPKPDPIDPPIVTQKYPSDDDDDPVVVEF